MSDNCFRLPSGREVYICRLFMNYSYEGMLAGDPAVWGPKILKEVPEYVQSVMPPGVPLVVLDPGVKRLPEIRWVAELESRKGARTDDPDFNSHLFVCWFTDDLSGSFRELLRPVLHQLNWEANANDYDFTLM